MAYTALVDKNVLRSSDLLELFLRQDPENRIALTDFCCMESYKGACEVNLQRSIRELEPLSGQVLILKGTREIARLSLAAPLDTEAFVDPAQTAGFKNFVGHVRRALAGDTALRKQLDEHSQVANEYLAKVQMEAAGIVPGVLAVAENLPKDTIGRLRRGDDPTGEDMEVFIPGMLLMARQFYLNHADFGQLPDPSVLRQSFIFRFAVAGYLLAIDWIRRGGIEGASAAKLGNDVVDMNYVAMATYFDDFLTRDTKVQSIYAEARWFINEVFGDRA